MGVTMVQVWWGWCGGMGSPDRVRMVMGMVGVGYDHYNNGTGYGFTTNNYGYGGGVWAMVRA